MTEPAVGPKVFRNKYPGKCNACSLEVPKGEGILWGSSGHWKVAHVECRPDLADQVLAREILMDGENARMKLAVEEAQRTKIGEPS